MKHKLVPVKDHPNLAKDIVTGAVLNININEMQQAKRAKELRMKKDSEIEEMKSELIDIKRILKELMVRQSAN